MKLLEMSSSIKWPHSILPQGNELFVQEQVKVFLLKHEKTILQYAVDSGYQQTLLAKFTISKSS